MRIILMTLSTPTYNNVRAASALPYHLIMGAKELGDIDFEVYSYNINEIDAAGIAETERSLNVRLHLLQKPWWVTWMFRLHLGILRVLLKYPYLSYLRVPEETIKKIKSSNPDIIWIYGEEIAGIAKTFEGIKRIVTMPDCESMFYYRMLRQRWATKHLSQILRYAFAYWQYRSMERRNCHANVIYHFVGETDAEFFKNINPSSKAIFLRHPLYAFNELKKIAFSEPKIKLLFAGRYDFYCEHGATKHLSQILRYAFAYWQYRSMERRNCHANVIYHFVGETDAEFFKNINPSSKAIFLRHPLYAFNELKKIAFSEPKIKLLFAGRYDFYCEHGSNELLDAMLGRKQDLINNFEITFLGKGWETWNERLKTAGFVSSHIKFAPNYITELQKHDIQINAIDVGTGTKGKVLDAISNGLLAFGTNYALENVAVRNGESCVQYSTVEEAMDRLMDICAHRNQYEQMAENGRKIVLLEHDRGKIADTLFDITKAK